MKPWTKTIFVIVVILQMAVLALMAGKRMHLLENGTPVTLKCVPVDPRSLFSGDYVVLNYDISRLPMKLLVQDDAVQLLEGRKGSIAKNDRVYIGLELKAGARFWHAAAFSKNPADVKGKFERVIRGTVEQAGPNCLVRYGIESYFVPQFQGLAIEKEMKDVSVEAVLSPDGEAAIRKLFIRDKEVEFY